LDFIIEEILTKLNIDYTLKDGQYSASCPNPTHYDKNPSWSIQKSEPYFHNCFACDFSGNIYSLVRNLTGKSLSEFIGNSDYNKIKTKITETKKRTPTKRISSVEGNLFSIYDNAIAYNYLKSKNISDEFIDFFNLQYSFDAKFNGTDFYKRVCIPVYFEKKLVAVEGRDVTGKSKIKCIYPKGSKVSILFNWDNIDKTKMVYIVEGITDLASVWQTISKNVVSTFSKNLTKKQKDLINTLPSICIIPDNDAPKNDTINETISVYDEFYDREFYIGYIRTQGADPNDLSEEELLEVDRLKTLSIDYIIDKTQLFKKDRNEW